MTPMTRFKNQISIIRKEMTRLNFTNKTLNGKDSGWFYTYPGEDYREMTNIRAITQDFIELFTHRTPHKNHFATIGFEYFYKNLDEKDFFIKVSCLHKERTSEKAIPYIQNKTISGYESKDMSSDEFKVFLHKFIDVVTHAKTEKEVFEWIHSSEYNNFSFMVMKDLSKKRVNTVAI